VTNPPPVSVAAIADLLAWARRLSDGAPHFDPAERAAYQAAKTSLLARIATQQHQDIATAHPDRTIDD
jgi:hypothetical protein